MTRKTKVRRESVDSAFAQPGGARRREGSTARRRFGFGWERVEERTLLSMITWANDVSGDWDNPAMWGGAVPGPSDAAVIPFADITVTHGTSTSDAVNSLNSQAAVAITGGSLALASTSSINNTLSLSPGGTLTGSGNITVEKEFTWTGGTLAGPTSSSLTAQGGVLITGNDINWQTLDGRALYNAGTAIRSRDGGTRLLDGASFTNMVGATFLDEATRPGDPATGLYDNGGSGTAVFANYGSYVKSGDDGTVLSLIFDNYGSVTVHAGDLWIGPGASAGSYAADSGTTLHLGGQNLVPSSSVSGDNVVLGACTIAGSYRATTSTAIGDSSGTTSFTGTVTSVGTVTVGYQSTADFSPATGGPVVITMSGLMINHGTLTGSDSFIVSGAFNWSDGTLSGPSGSSLTAQGGLLITGNDINWQTLDGRALYNAGTAIRHRDGGTQLVDGASFINLAGASYLDQDTRPGDPATGLYCTDGSGAAFLNYGSYVKSGNDGTILALTVVNYGSVTVHAGDFWIGGGSSTGSIGGDPGTTLHLGGQTLSTNSSISGDNAVLADCTVAGSYSAATSTVIGDSSGTTRFTGPVSSVGSLTIGNQATADFSPSGGVPVTVTLPALAINHGALTGSDSFIVNGAFDWSDGTLSGPSGSSLTAQGGLLITGNDINWQTLDGRALYNAGTAIRHRDGGTQLVNGASFINLAGASYLDQDTRPGDPATGLYCTDGSGAVFLNYGSYVKSGNDGTILALTVDNYGSVTVQSGTLRLATATNAGTVTVAAGASLGAGNYTQTTTGSLNLELGGTAASSIGRLAVSGTATLAGQLNVTTSRGFTPVLGNTFQILTFGSSSGNFNTYSGTSLAGGLFLDPVFSASRLTLETDQVAISGAPASPVPGVPINLMGTVTGPSVGSPSIFAFSWSVTQNGDPFTSGTGSTIYFTPNLSATYVMTLTVSDAAGGNGTTTLQVVVPPSIVVLNSTANAALSVSGGANVTIPGGVVVDSSSPGAISLSGKSQLTASMIDVLGGVKTGTGSSVSPAPTTGISVPDPLAALIGPDPTGMNNYGATSLNTGSLTINPGIYSQIKVSKSASLTLSPGIYIIEGGGLTVTGDASISGSGVMIYNAGSSYPSSGGKFSGITMSSTGTIGLSAPLSGPYAGVLIFQSHQNTLALSLSGNALTGLNGTIYAPSAALSLSGNAQLQQGLVVGTFSVSGPVALSQTAAGSGGSGDAAGLANTLVAGDLSVYINDPSGGFSTDELARIQDAINTWDIILAPYNVTITEVGDPSLANLMIDTSTTSASGGMAAGVLGCYYAPSHEITIIQGWSWFAGADPGQIGAGQYDFETTMLHELGHALGLGHSTNPSSPMYATLATGVADRTVTTTDLNIPDPPAGADPQMAAGFRSDSTPPAAAQNGLAVVLGSAANAAPFGMIARPSASRGQWSVVRGPWSVAPGPVGVQAGPESSLVVQETEQKGEQGRALWVPSDPAELLSALDVSDQPAGPPGQPEGEATTGSNYPVILDGTNRDDETVAVRIRLHPELAIDAVLDELALCGTGFQPVSAIPTGKMLGPHGKVPGRDAGFQRAFIMPTGKMPVPHGETPRRGTSFQHGFMMPTGSMPAPDDDLPGWAADFTARLGSLLVAAGLYRYGAGAANRSKAWRGS
jgi:hypothetical protein